MLTVIPIWNGILPIGRFKGQTQLRALGRSWVYRYSSSPQYMPLLYACQQSFDIQYHVDADADASTVTGISGSKERKAAE